MIDIKLKLLEEYYNKNKTINNINQKYIEIYNGKEIKLGSFINDMRKTYKKYLDNKELISKKNLERIEFLTKLNIDWNPNNNDWCYKYKLLKDYYNKYKNIDIPYEYKINNVKLGVFLSNQRVLYRKYNKSDNNKTLEEHFKLLEELNIVWNPQDNDWNTKYETCKKYYEEHCNLNVGEILTYNGINIGVFITNQRSLYQKIQNNTIKRKDLTNINNHFKLLEEIGIIWYPNKSKKEEIKQELINYKNTHDNLDIKSNYKVLINNEEFSLGQYVSDTRELYKKEKETLTINQLERIKLLNNLGINWDPNETNWQEKYELLKEYKEEFNDINVPINYKVIKNDKTINLGKFISKQREIYRKHKTNNFKDCESSTINHIKLLEDLGIVWNPKKEDWKELYTYIKYYYDKYHTINISQDTEIKINKKIIKIGRIIQNQKDSLNKRKNEIEKGTAPIEIMLRYNMLSKLGFSFTNKSNIVTYNKEDYNINELCKEKNINITTFKKYYKKFEDCNKAVRACLLLKEIKIKKELITINDLLKEFNLNINELTKSLEKTIKNNTIKNNTILYSKDTNLIKYCKENNYDYNIVINAYNLKKNKLLDENLKETINRVLIDYKSNKIPTWIYYNYGNELILKDFLDTLDLDTNMILKDMKNNACTINEAIKHVCFKIQTTKDKNDYLEVLYNDLIKNGNDVNYKDKLIKKYKLQNYEINTLNLSIEKYKLSIKKLNIFLKNTK